MYYRRLMALVTLLSLVSASIATAGMSPPLFLLNKKEYRLEDVSPKYQSAYYKEEVEALRSKQQLLGLEMLDIHFATVAAKTKKTVEQVTIELLAIAPVTDEDIQSFYENFKDRIGAPLESVKPRIQSMLEDQSRQQKKNELIAELQANGTFVNLLPELEAPVFKMDLKGYPSKGKANAPIKLVEFADYRCSYCVEAKAAIEKVMKEYPDKIEFFYIDYPVIDRGTPGISTAVAHGGYCAGKQGKYWQFHNKAYDMASRLDMNSSLAIAKELGLNQKKFDICMATKKEDAYGEYVKKALDFAQEIGVLSTPSFFINGQPKAFNNLEEDLKKEVERLINAKKK